MIKTHKEELAGDVGTVCDISGTSNDVYNDFRALIDMIYDHREIAHIFIDAWDNILEVRGIDKNNISNKSRK